MAMLLSLSEVFKGPLPGYGGAAITCFQLISIATSYANEAYGTPTPYSKFAANMSSEASMLPSRIGMSILYGLPFLAGVGEAYRQHTLTSEVALASSLCVAHFFKRVMEVQFVHKYSGKMPGTMAGAIGVMYSLYSLLILGVAARNPSSTSRILGISLFSIGALGNLYHHVLLASLRPSPAQNTKYVLPTGGLFAFVAAPHYFFELVGWLGIAVASEHTNVYLIFLSMASYLFGRARAQNEWNRNKFKDEWPASRRNIVPFFF